MSDLPRLFDIREQPVGLLRRQVLLDNLAGHLSFDRRGIGQAHDHLIGELLPEAITPDGLAAALATLEGDDFARNRDAQLVAVYRAYLERLAADGRYDSRAIHSIVADRIARGDLASALRGAKQLHIYGFSTLRTRRRLVQALREQPDVDVVLYLPAGRDTVEWESAVVGIRDLPGGAGADLKVQPAPDERRELDWVTVQVKKLLVEQRAPADMIAIIARAGREDARAAHEVLTAAGIPATARLRATLDEVPALKAILFLFRAAARNWSYRQLRHVLTSPYFDLAIDLRPLDRIAKDRRVVGLEAWTQALGLERTERFQDFTKKVAPLASPRSTREWLALTREMLDPGWFAFRDRVCRVGSGTASRLDTVRLDQQAIVAVDGLLRDWADFEPDGPLVAPIEWYARLRRFLGDNEITLATPLRTGVQILEAHEAALFPFDHAFVIHANDGEFPKRPGTSWLFTDEELRRLRVQGLPVGDRAELMRRERVLWEAVSAGPDVTVTYRTADPNGIPLLPSLMVPPHDAASEIPRTKFVWEDPVTPAYADRLAVRNLLERRDAVPHVAPVRRAILNAVAERQRAAQLDGAWSGRIRDPGTLQIIANQFGSDYAWSASQLELYAKNPFVFLVERVLKLDELEEAEEDTSALTFGSVAHTLLERFYRGFTGPLPADFDGAIRSDFDPAAEAVLAEIERGTAWLGLQVLWAVTRRDIKARVADFLAWELPRFKGRRPHLFEHGFGDDGAFWIEGPDLSGQDTRLRIRGRIDRVDKTDDGALHVVDYKSGMTPSPQSYEDGAALQGPVYMAALRRHVGVAVASAVYLSVRGTRRSAEIFWDDPACARAVQMAFSIPARVRAGRFENLAAASCGWLNYWPGLDVCRTVTPRDDGCRFDD
jgi:RecB family exonuclease